MILNTFERVLMNNPIRATLQRAFEVPQLIAMGGKMAGGRALELGCGRGVGTELILDVFGAETVDAFDLDPRMALLAHERLQKRGDKARVWVGDATAIDAPDDHYDAVFDFGIIHHIPDWRAAIGEVARVLRPGGTFYCEEVLAQFILNPVWRRLFDHPEVDRFDANQLAQAITSRGLDVVAQRGLWGDYTFLVAKKPDATRT